MPKLKLVSHSLCPYVQRAVIALAEKGAPFERVTIDLAEKPEWFRAISPLGKVPVLLVDGQPIFESAVILEYLEETIEPKLHPPDPLRRADHRAWIEFGSTILNDIGAFYTAKDAAAFESARQKLVERFAWLERRTKAEPWFDGEAFSLVDAVFGSVFRYFDVFDAIQNFGILANKPKIARWRAALAARPAIKGAVAPDYPDRLRVFLVSRGSHLSGRMAEKAAA
jgi:glutathione S-transferase